MVNIERNLVQVCYCFAVLLEILHTHTREDFATGLTPPKRLCIRPRAPRQVAHNGLDASADKDVLPLTNVVFDTHFYVRPARVQRVFPKPAIVTE
jgi:hypothetical protein